MTLTELKWLVTNAEVCAKNKGVAEDDYQVYVIQRSGNISEIRSWSPADWNRGGVALIVK